MRYFVFIDETGEANISKPDPRYNLFVLCGVMFQEDHYQKFNENLNRIKIKYFGRDDIVLHSYCMRKNNGVFKIFQDKDVLHEFYKDIEPIFTQENYQVISCIVNKVEYRKRYADRNYAYEDALTFLCERAMSCMGKNKKSSLHFCLEKRDNRKDRELKKVYNRIIRFGTEYKSTEEFQLCNPHLFFRGKSQNINGLQMADLCAYPIARKSLSPDTPQPTFDLFERQIFKSRYGKQKGYGLKYFP